MEILAEYFLEKFNKMNWVKNDFFKPHCSVFIDRHYFCHILKLIVRFSKHFGFDFDGDYDASKVVTLVRARRAATYLIDEDFMKSRSM